VQDSKVIMIVVSEEDEAVVFVQTTCPGDTELYSLCILMKFLLDVVVFDELVICTLI